MLYNRGMIFFILSFFVGYILSFGLVTLRTIWLCARAGTHIEHRCSRSHTEDVTITDVIIKTPAGKWDVNDVMPGSDGLGILVIFEKAGVDFRIWMRPVQLCAMGCATRCWVRWNSQHSKNCISLFSCRKN